MGHSTARMRPTAETADQRVILHGVPWSLYETHLELRGEASGPRFSYLSGALEIMAPSKSHEGINSYIGRLVEAYALDAGIPFTPYGSWTLKAREKGAGAEPDECYIFGPDQSKSLPDLVIEVVWTSGGIQKLEIYRRLGVGEFWQWDEGRIQVYVLRRDRYVRVKRSAVLPGLDLDLLVSCLDRASAYEAILDFRQALAKGPPRARRRR